jgi:2,4-dienoyl-CoA reductase-like NADH-dependent reductase (Old Yellow Enzyme family)|tara:strand:- start:4535 stop:5614 length:1080 start_codon:yes stop_codon:yes gene_type:complete
MLFEEYKLKNLVLRNRVVMAPMTRNQSPGGIPTDDVISYYARRAKAEVGLIITEGIEVSHKASSAYPNVPRLDTNEAREGWKKVVDGIKNNNGAVIAQLWHCGGFRKLGMQPNPEVPGYTASGLVKPGKKVAHEMTIKDIKETIDAYASDAKICQDLGFDGVEIHGAHGYLIDNFLWGGTNIREDSYGGSIGKRSQFVSDIIKAVKENVDDTFIVGLRFSQWKQHDFSAKLASTPDDLRKILIPPVEAGLDFLHSSMRRFWESEFEDSEENLAYWTKKISNIPTIGVGSVGLDSDFIDMTAPAKPTSIDKALDDIAKEKYDLIAVGRALLSDYEWVVKMKEGRLNDVIPYTKDALLNLY